MASISRKESKVKIDHNQSLSTKFTEKRLTSRAGLVPLLKFTNKIGLEETIEKQVDLNRGQNSLYPVGMVFKILVTGIVSGCRHLSHLTSLENDPVVMKAAGWQRFPVVSTITRILERFNFGNCVELARAESILRQKVWNHKWFARVNLDLDSSAKSAFGHQQGVEWGHNTERSGKKMLNPIFAFISQTQECLHCWLRPGDTFSANGSVEFLKECLGRLPKRVWSIVVRADAAFFSRRFIDIMEKLGLGYIIKVKTRGWIKLCAGLDWRKAKGLGGVWTAEFSRQISGQGEERCFIAVRRLIRMETEGLLMPIPVYQYGLWVTNLPGSPLSLEKFYNKRAVAENLIGEGKREMAFGSMLVQEFWANHALLQAAVLAYNLSIWFRRLVLEKPRWTQRANTFRFWFVCLAGRLLFSSGRWVLALPAGYLYQKEWLAAEARLEALIL